MDAILMPQRHHELAAYSLAIYTTKIGRFQPNILTAIVVSKYVIADMPY